MPAWSRVRPEQLLHLDLHAHALLAGVPIHDVWRVDLPGGGAERTLDDVRRLMSAESVIRGSPIVRSLFALRFRLGSLLHWDAPASNESGESLLHALPQTLRERSTVLPGSRDGPFTVLYVLEREALSEIRNATVHAFSLLALQSIPGGYRLYWVIYVAPVSWLTPVYMALIAPFRRFLVYPAILRRLRRAWLTELDRESP